MTGMLVWVSSHVKIWRKIKDVLEYSFLFIIYNWQIQKTLELYPKCAIKSLLISSQKKNTKRPSTLESWQLTTDVNWSEPVTLRRVLLIATNALLTDYSLLTNCKSALLSQDNNQSHLVYIHLHWWHSIFPHC